MAGLLEQKIELDAVKIAEKAGFFVRKLEWIGRRNAPDRVFSREDRGTVFIEFKRPGERPSAAQAREHERMRKAGMEVHWADSVEMALEILGIER